MSGPEHRDVLIVGAGLSGIGMAWRLQQRRPATTYAILEQRDAIGGTWDLFRYPGVRSDSDMFTLAYPFRPWREPESMALGASIRRYLDDTADAAGIRTKINFRTTVVAASWSSETARWTVQAQTATGSQTWTCAWLLLCSGYYDYAQGYQPEIPGRDDFSGDWVHPQHWPADLDHAGRRVVVIGSGATAVTLVPALAEQAAHVIMLQRSPSYLTVLGRTDPHADRLRARLPAGLAHRILRFEHAVLNLTFYQLARRRPERVKKILRGLAVKSLRDEAYVQEHFTPTYEPWDQRLCVVPDGDLFAAIRGGRAEVVTDRIERVTATGIRLRSGRELDADVIVSATGLTLRPLGGLELSVDGEPIDPGTTVAYRGLMLAGVPNLTLSIGYVNASWTLRSDLVARYVTRLLGYLDRKGYASATPRSTTQRGRPLLDLTSGYVQRSVHRFPQQGERDPWLLRQNYLRDAISLHLADLSREMIFARHDRLSRRDQPARHEEPAA